MKVFSEMFDAHEASKVGDATDEDEVFPVNVDAHDVSALHVDSPSEVAVGVNVRLYAHPLVMARGDESGDRGAGGSSLVGS